MTAPPAPPTHRQFPCKSCGANLEFAPGTRSLVCPYCGAQNEVAAAERHEVAHAVEELDFHQHISRIPDEELEDVLTVRCTNCGAEEQLPPNVTARKCAFCGAGLVAHALSKRQIKPRSLLPFHITRQQAGMSFKQWIGSRWFAPNALKRQAERSDIDGAYIPAWTYDTDTTTRYRGERGEDYWETQTVTVMVNGKPQRQTRQVRKTRWYPASGTVFNRFDDVLVLASNSLPPKIAYSLEPWDLGGLIPYRDEYLSGFVAESYQIDLPHGFELAKGIMAPHIDMTIRHDIGGDHQRIHWADTRYDNVTFKHLLLPVWISAYRYAGKTFRFLVNARTGEVQGERPYSWVKITLAVLAVVLAIVLFYAISQGGVRF